MKSYKMMYHISSLFLIFRHSDMKEEDSLSNNAELLLNNRDIFSSKVMLRCIWNITFILFSNISRFEVYLLHLNKKCCSSSISPFLQTGQYLSSLGILRCLPLSIIKGCALMRILHIKALCNLVQIIMTSWKAIISSLGF